MSADVRTVADSRVVAEQGVVLNQYVGPLNWEHYKIPASGLSNSQITFNNITTLGVNRIYDSNFEIEYTIQITYGSSFLLSLESTIQNWIKFQPFPLHWVCDQLRANINGAACMVRPQENLMQRMMYWRQSILDKTCSYCPHTKAPQVLEPVINFLAGGSSAHEILEQDLNFSRKYHKSVSRDIGTPLNCISFSYDTGSKTATITFREPVLCPPFNQRLDHIYQAPLFNVTSFDMVYQLNDLRHMLMPLYKVERDIDTQAAVTSKLTGGILPSEVQSINITSAMLCYNVASMPPGMEVPPMLQLPYYNNVCYVTDCPVTSGTTGTVTMTSGVYTLAQVPTSIYVFVSENQLFRTGNFSCAGGGGGATNCDYNCSLSPIKNINITMGNNTQLLNTTSEFDRYQMALANGLEDVSWEEFTRPLIQMDNISTSNFRDWTRGQHGNKCILKLVPGVDLLIPERRLVGGMDAGQLVFQVSVEADVTGVPDNQQPYLALWLMFEYCGTLSIQPVHAEIDMVPIKSMPPIGGIDMVTDSSADAATGGGEGTNPTGAGILDWVKGAYRGVKGLWNSKIGKTVRGVADKFLSGEGLPLKRGPVGGTIIGGGDFYD